MTISILAGLGGLCVLVRAPTASIAGEQLDLASPPTTTSTTAPTTSGATTSGATATTSMTETSSPSTSTTTRAAPPGAAMQVAPTRKVTAKSAPPAAPMTLEQRGAAALALIAYPWQWTGYHIVFSGPDERLLGFTQEATKQIDVYVRPDEPIATIAWVTAHEIGHSVDFSMTTEQEHADYRRIRGLDDRPWLPACDTCSDYASPAGDWAETFAYALLGNGPFASLMAPRPSAAQLVALRPVFAATPPAAPAVTTTTTTTTTTATTAPTSQPAPRPAGSAPPPPAGSPPPRSLLGSLLGG